MHKAIPPKGADVVAHDEYRALMSDGKVLSRMVLKFTPGPYDNGKPQRHDYGWKLYRKLKPGLKAVDVVEAWCSDYERMGWERQTVRDGGW